ncbi:MAG: Cof-type HAD-IIB family hydrolase, partial [Lachnospiraceae bacterium]|nr:Cof-type HAD-IIB family hydrolase [Lachnospiraceae bacterium]
PQKHWVANWGFDKDDYVSDLYEQMGEDALTIGGYTDGIEINKFSADILVQTEYDTIKSELGEYFDFIEHGITPDVLQDEVKMSDPETVLGVVEIVPKGMSKAVGMEHVCELLGIPKEDCYAVGDSMNDLEMFEAAGHAIAMGNAMPAAKAAAEWVTTGIHEDGILNAMMHYGLI